jgi:SAP domain-containing ribonucleoprotein
MKQGMSCQGRKDDSLRSPVGAADIYRELTKLSANRFWEAPSFSGYTGDWVYCRQRKVQLLTINALSPIRPISHPCPETAHSSLHVEQSSIPSSSNLRRTEYLNFSGLPSKPYVRPTSPTSPTFPSPPVQHHQSNRPLTQPPPTMSTDYSKKKNAELEELLKSRSLPHTGKKADLIARLQQHDTDQAAAAASSSKPTAAAAPPATEDEIDWEDDAAAATNPASAATIAAGGLAPPANPTAVPNQVPAIAPSKTSDLTTNPPSTTTTDPPTTTPKPSLSANLPTTTLTTELSKRLARAARFGTTSTPTTTSSTTTDTQKALERAQKFGTGDNTATVKGLDEALPERGVKRGRGREDRDGGGAGDGRGEKRSRVRDRVRGEKRTGSPKGGRGGGLSEKDRLAAEARKAKFAQKA